jgi:hypothetical protein
MERHVYLCLLVAALFIGCGSSKKTSATDGSASQPAGPAFNADSAYAYCAAQCSFGARTMNSEAHERCGQWIVEKFKQYGLTVVEQKATLTGYDGTKLQNTNIIASYKPELTTRILLCAHWDSRPWADNDPDSANWKKPVMAANDGASGVAVMLEVARLLANDSLGIGVDFVCFDAEDWGTPQWSDQQDNGDVWALGAKYWAAHPHKPNYEARFGILLDMVGGQGAQFHQELNSKQYAQGVIDKVWAAAQTVGFGSYFPATDGGMITDDHVPVNETANIPTIDIIAFYPDCQQSSFGPTWHTISDTMENIDKNTLQAVGQTIVQVLFTEK